ncbi:uncharacterized protein Bfra_010044 [Botrytis fragariae]|uniref:Uncharacterized protein n=1 Tax=Botrytis fragariae TaxID=1964551 RepID=A0A8H6AM49_9HELO|nr:uncharacterized protein Bfra_010044 [Botrytis fragariae]KAF5869899.1 hypothetical protein Bfra_010044 [Botrytis fragariae]
MGIGAPAIFPHPYLAPLTTKYLPDKGLPRRNQPGRLSTRASEDHQTLAKKLPSSSPIVFRSIDSSQDMGGTPQ